VPEAEVGCGGGHDGYGAPGEEEEGEERSGPKGAGLRGRVPGWVSELWVLSHGILRWRFSG